MNRVSDRLRGTVHQSVRAALVVVLGLCAGLSYAQRISDVPLPVKNNVAPNFMFMIDSSTSMYNIVATDTPYSATATYPLDFTCTTFVPAGSTVSLRISTSGPSSGRPTFVINNNTTRYQVFVTGDTTYARRCFIPTATYSARLWTDSIAGNPRSTTGYGAGSYTGHFLNWYFSANGGPTTGWLYKKALTSGEILTRIEIAKRTAKNLLDDPLKASAAAVGPTPAVPVTVRVGLSRYYDSDNTDGGALLVGMGDLTDGVGGQKTAMKTAIDNIILQGSTPLAETLGDIGRYMATGYSGNVPIRAGATTNVAIDTLLRQPDGGAGSPPAGRNSCLAAGTASPAVRNCASSTTDAQPSAPSVGTPTRPVQYWCQRNYAFLLTDGLPTKDEGFKSNTYINNYAGVGDTDYLDDVAKALFELDLRPNLVAPSTRAAGKLDKIGGQPLTNLRTYTIGFGDKDVTESPLLASVAAAGGGQFIGADSASKLQIGFRKALVDAFSNASAAAAVGVANPQVADGKGIGYSSSYQSGQWFGDLVAYPIDKDTGLPGTQRWSLRSKLSSFVTDNGFASRKIVLVQRRWAGIYGSELSRR